MEKTSFWKKFREPIDSLERQALQEKGCVDTDKIIEHVSSVVVSTLSRDRSAECVQALRRLHVLLCNSHLQPRLSDNFLAYLVRFIVHAKDFSDRSLWLCSLILQMVTTNTSRLTDNQMGEKAVLYSLPVLLNQPSEMYVDEILPQIMRWISTVGFDTKIQKQALAATVTIATLHSSLLTEEQTGIVDSQLIEWLYGASSSSSVQSPASKGFFSRDQQLNVSEIDGAPVKDFFTPLCLVQHYSSEQIMSIHSFSCLRSWIEEVHKQTKQIHDNDHDTANDRSSSDDSHDESTNGEPDNQSLGGTSFISQSGDMSVYLSLDRDNFCDKMVDYCIRVIDQCSLKSKYPQDTAVQKAALIECIELLDSICGIDSRLIGRVNSHIDRVTSYTTLSQPTVLLSLLKFCLHHGEKALYSSQALYELYFDKAVLMYHGNPLVAFDTITFLRDNIMTLYEKTTILTTYFPNIFKILAWNPCTFVADFMDLIPIFITQATFLEDLGSRLGGYGTLSTKLHHAGIKEESPLCVWKVGKGFVVRPKILKWVVVASTPMYRCFTRLPCISAALVAQKEAEKVDVTPYFSTESKNSTDAYNNSYFRPMFNFILRIEGGHGDTIDRLNVLHKLLEDKTQHPRVVTASETTPVLLKLYLNVIMTDGSYDLATQLVPVILERASLLYCITEYQKSIRKLFSNILVEMVKTYPQLLMDNYSEILDFINNILNIKDKENIFTNLIWMIGEFASSTYDSRCSTEVIGSLYESLEALAYEVSGLMLSGEDVYSTRILTVLMSATAKLASRSQDLLPRMMLCLTKLGQQHSKSSLPAQSRRIIQGRASELNSLLKLPNVAAFVLTPPVDIEHGSWHTDNTSMPVLLKTTASFLQPP